MKTRFAMLGLLALVAALFTAAPGAATAGPTARLTPLPMAEKLLVPAAVLMRVDEGVFELEIGKTIDMTNVKMLLAITLVGTDQRCCELTINGGRVTNWQVGSRIDLKKFRETRDFVKDRDQCFLDVVDIVTPKGSPGTATFRLHCI